jgi:Ca2+-binding RTX toxin-like protein
MRGVTMVAALVAALMMTAGIALAESFRGDDGPNTIGGTNDADRIVGLAGDDDLYGLGGDDDIFGNRGDDDIFGGDGGDTISAGRGDDYIDVQGDGRIDDVDCGSGRDVVRANPEDNLAANCEASKSVVGPK